MLIIGAALGGFGALKLSQRTSVRRRVVMNHPVEPDGNSRGSAHWSAICGTLGALIGGCGAVFLAMLLANLYVVVWDPKPASSYGYGDPFAGLGTALLYGCFVFLLGAVLGGFVAVKLSRRVMFARWKNRTPGPARPGKANH